MPVPLKTGQGTVLMFCLALVIVSRRTLQPTDPFMSTEYIKTHGLDFDSKSNPATPPVKMRHSAPSPPCQGSDFVICLWGKEGNFLKFPDPPSP